jgi:hypothetical protein
LSEYALFFWHQTSVLEHVWVLMITSFIKEATLKQ